MRRLTLGFAAILTLAICTTVDASVFSCCYTGTYRDDDQDATTLCAQAIFELKDSSLVVTLTNRSTDDVRVPNEVLTAVFFDIGVDPVPSSAPLLTPLSAVLADGSAVYQDGAIFDVGHDGDVGGEWAYKGGLTGAPHGATQGISAAGFGYDDFDLFGPHDLFPGPSWSQGPPDGLGFGITSAGDDLSTQNGGVSGIPIIKNSVVFTLAGLPDGFQLSDITNLSFQYGTDLEEGPNITPEPASIVVWSLITATGVAWGCWRRRKRPMA